MKKSIFRFITLLGIVVMVFGGAGSMAAQSGSGSCPWDEDNFVEVSSAAELNTALSTGGEGTKSIRLTGNITVDADITSSIDATIDLNGKAIDYQGLSKSIKVTGGCLNIFESFNGNSLICGLLSESKAFIVESSGTLNFYGGKFSSDNKGTGISNKGTVNVYGGTFEKLGMCIDNEGTLFINGGTFKGNGSGTGVNNSGKVYLNQGSFEGLKKGIDNTQSVFINGGTFKGNGSGTGVYNGSDVYVLGGTFEGLDMGIYNANSLFLNVLPTVGTGNGANATADIGLAAGSVITMAGEINSLPADYVKMKVGQFSYDESSGDYMAGSAPYVVTSGYKDKVKGIHPAMMFQAYDPNPDDDDYYEFCAKGGTGTDAGEAQIVEVDRNDITWTNPDNSRGSGAIISLLGDNPQWADGAVIRLNRNVDIGEHGLIPSSSNGRTSFTLDLNGHLLTGSPHNQGILYFDGKNVTICDSGEGGMIAVNSGNKNSAVSNHQGSLTITGGSFFSEGEAIDNSSGTLTVSGGTFTGGRRAVYNGSQCTATISGGTFIGVKDGGSPIYNDGTMSLGRGTAEVKVIADGSSSAIDNYGALTVGENVTIKSGTAAGIYNEGTLTVAGFPTFDAGNACDIGLFKAKNGSNTFISFTADIPGGPANPINIKIEDINGNPVTPGTSGLTLTSGYAAHVKRGGSGADKDRPQEPGLVFTVLGVADGTYLLLSGGEAVAYAGSFPVAEVKSGDDTYTYNIGTGALGLSTAAGALVQAVYAADRVDDDTTVKMLCDVDLGTAWLDFRTFTSAVGVTPENAKKMTLDLNGFELSGCQINVIDNSVYSLTVVNTGTDGGILQYGADGACIYNDRELTVKGVTLRATGVSCNRIYNFGTLTIDGEMKFLGSVDANDVYLAYGKTFGIGESLNLSAKLKVYVEYATNVPRKLTTGYGTTVRYEAGDANAGKVKAPGDVFTVTNIGGNKLAFAGGEAWVVPSGTLALIQTATAVSAYTTAATLYNDVETLTDDATVMLADDVDIKSLCLQFLTAGKLFTLDLGGHTLIGSHTPLVIVEGGALLDIIDSGGSGLIKSPGDGFEIIRNDASTLSIVGALTIEHIGTNTKGIRLKGGTTTLKGWPAFNRGEDAGSNIYLENGALISFTDDISAAPAQKISVTYKGDNLGTLTSGYGAHVTYPAGHEKAGKPIDPDEIFTYKPYGSLVAKVHAKLEGSDDAAEAAFWMPHQMVAYIDAAGDLHDDLTGSTPEATDDGHDAYILDGTEKTLGKSGTDTWYVALPSLPKHDNSGYTHVNSILLNGDVHLVLADGCDMGAFATTGYGCFLGDASTSLTIYAQSDGQKKGKLTTDLQSDGTAAIRAGTVTINGGNIDLSANPIYDCYAIYADGGGLTFNGGEVRSLEKYGFYANDCGITVNGGNIRTLKERDNGIGIYCQTTGGHTIDINGGTVIAEGDKAGIWATNDINIKSDVSAVGTGIGSYAIYSAAGNINISGGKVTADASNLGYYGIYSNAGTVSITAGQVKANGMLWGIYAKKDIFLSLSDATEFISSNQYSVESGGVKIPRGQYLGVSDLGCVLNEACGSADADYVFDAPGNTTLNYISGKTLKKAFPVVGSGKYMACDRTDGYWLLGDETVALYPTGVKFNKKLDGTITAEVILSEIPLAGVPKDRAVILASATEGNVLGTFALTCANESSGDGITSSNIEDDYAGRNDILPNFIATDGAKTFADLIGEATGTTVSTAEQARDYLVFTLTGDRFVPITFAYDDTPAAGHCLLVIPKINILLHQGLGKGAGESSSQARRISLGGGESAATGVNGVIGVGEAKDDTYFGLDGRRLSGRPSQKGVYIRGGQKVVVR